MKNPKDFIKLFDLNVPSVEHFDYYIDQLAKTDKFKDIKYLLDLFENADSLIDNIYQYRLHKSQEIVEFIKTTNCYADMCHDMSLVDLPINQNFQYEDDVNYISIDIIGANWTSLKKYDQINELGVSYSDLLSKFEMPQVFIHSKYLRQFIFGNVNPRKQQKVQRNIIQEIVRKYQSDLVVECVRNDEVIFKFNDFVDIDRLVSEIDTSKYRVKIFSVKRVEDFRIDTIFDSVGNILNREMVGVSGQQFYWKFKQYITGEKIDIRDLYFKHDGKLGVWMVDELKISI